MLITDKELQKIVGNIRNFSVGKRYYQLGYITNIEINHSSILDEYLIRAVVNNDGYENESTVIVNDQNKIISYDCNCYWCDLDSACGHIIAVLLKIQNLSPDEFPFVYNERNNYLELLKEKEQRYKEEIMQMQFLKTKNLINNLREVENNKFNAMIKLQKYDIQVLVIDEYQEPLLKFKVGKNKKYVIKNIYNFIQAIDNREKIKYGKALEFIHDESLFSDEALELIELMKYCLLLEQKDGDDYYYYETRAMKNAIAITSSNIDRIYDILESNEDLNVYSCEFKPKFQVTRHNSYYKIELESDRLICSKSNIYRFRNNKIIKTVSSEKIINLIEVCNKEDGLFLQEDDVDDFIKYIINDIKDDIELNGDELTSTIINNEVLTLFGDINDLDQVKVYIQSNQGGKLVYSFDHEGVNTSFNFDLIEDYLKEVADVIDYENHCIYMNLENEDTFVFLNEGLPFLANYCNIMVSDTLEKLGKKSNFKISVGITISNDLLAIDIDSVDIPKDELIAVLNSYKKKKKYHRLRNGKLIYLESDDLEELDDFINDLNLKPKMLENNHLEMNTYRAFNIDSKNCKHIKINRTEAFKETINKFRNVQKNNYPLSDKYNKILRDYQKFGYQWLRMISDYGFGGILADDMGLGKTLQIITLLDEKKLADKTSLVICPSSLLLNWQDEIHKFSNSLKCICIHGSVDERKVLIHSFNDIDVIITTYDYLRRDSELYKDYYFEYLILDEAQYIKNPKTKNAKSVKSLKAKHRFALTGTPIENSLAELWSIFDFLMPDYLYSYNYFQSYYETPIVKNHDEKKQSELKKLVSPFILRRNKKEVLTELPEKIEKSLLLEFNDEERKLYLANLMQVNKQLQEQLNYDDVDRIVILAMLTKLRQICCEPRILYDNISNISSKLSACLDLIRNFQGNSQKVLLFSSFTKMLDLIGEELEKEGISFYKLTGNTPKVERHQLVEQFQNDNTTVFLISLKAGGTGLNLTAAEAVIHFDPWWNMSAQNQATDRAYRIGQTNLVSVYKLVMKDSIEEKILELQNKKKNLSDSFVENNEGNITSMSTNDIIKLFNA